MSRISDWLAAHRLEQLQAVFDDNEIDADVLLELTDEDLRELGLSLGARKRLRAAIDATREAGGLPAADETRVAGGAERRHLTTMFVDLVGSTALSGRLDPEDMREIITGYQNAVAGVVTRYEGQIAKYMGDGVLCYFGWPRAHENDAERAVRSGLEIIDVLRGRETSSGEALTARVGIASGLVVVGDLIGEGAAQEQAVVGDTPNLAARLQAAAQPGEVVVSEATSQLLGQDFELATLGELDLKGIDGAVTAWRVLGERDLATRFEAYTREPVLPMVGRDHELGLILERWTRAVNGEGQVTVVLGDAGIGKSRLTRAVIEKIAAGDHYRVSYHCSPYHSDSSFYPVVQQLSYAFGFADDDSLEDKLDKLEDTLRAADPPIVAELMQLDGATRYGRLELTPQQVRLRIMKAMQDELRALAREKPVLLVVEDAHWIDASTLASLEACLDEIVRERVLMLMTARPTFAHGFGGHPIVSKLALNRLGSDQTVAVLSKITGGKSLPDQLVQEIIARTDGVPLFIEELIKTIIESGELRETETAFELDTPLSHVTIPATLHDSLMARIDRLQPVKEVAQMAACIGREFDRAALSRIARVDDRTLDEALAQLEAAELVFRRGLPVEARYVFKHALVRDVAYESLLKKKRQEIHRRLVEVFEGDPTVEPELIAHHATEAGLIEEAVPLWEKAGSAAQARPAYEEAINHLHTALKVIQPLLDRPEWRERELSLLVQLAQIYIAKEGYSSREASETFSKALERVDATDNAELRVAIYYGTWIAPYIGNRQHRALELATRLIDEMDNQPEPIPRLISHRMRAATLISMGRSTDALADLAISYDLYRSAEIADFSARFAQDLGVQIWCYELLALWLTGEAERAAELSERATARARELKHANTFCYAGLHNVVLRIWMGDVDRARATNAEMKRIAIEHDMTLWKVFCELHDEVLDCMEDKPEAAARLDAALSEYQASGGGLWSTLYLAEQAKHLLRIGDPAGAAAAVARAVASMEASGERWAEAELHRVEGEIHRAAGDLAGAEASYATAIAAARQQQARSLELRAANSAATLH